MNSRQKVLIIGGGFAGIAALKTLHDCRDIFSPVLLEASDGLGGRIKTVHTNEAVLELGATFIHGEEENTLYQIAHQLGMTKDAPPNTRSDITATKCVLSSGQTVSSSRYYSNGNLITDIFDELGLCAEKDDWSFILYPDKKEWSKARPSIMKGAMEYVKERFYSITTNSGEQSCDILQAILDNFMLDEAIMNGTDYSKGTGVSQYSEFEFCSGDMEIMLSQGFQGLVDAITAPLQSLCHLNKKVCSIEWEGDTVLVQCSDGTHYQADHVIVTVSLGVLQAEDISFNPPLPPSKQHCLTQLGMGRIGKVIVTFSSDLVPNIMKLKFLWRKEERLIFTDDPWAGHLYSMNRIGHTHSWVMWFSGDSAHTVELLSDEQLMEGIHSVLRLFLTTSPPIIRVDRAKWCTDPLIKGSYSYNKENASKDDRLALATPLGGASLKVLFAGEATNPLQFSLVNGAYDTGIREAMRLINHYQLT